MFTEWKPIRRENKPDYLSYNERFESMRKILKYGIIEMYENVK